MTVYSAEAVQCEESLAWRVVLEAFVEGDPVAQPRPRATSIGRHARLYDPGTAKPWRARISAALSIVRPPMIEREAALTLTFWLRRPKAHFKKGGDLKPTAPAFVTTKPDVDNLAKAVQDELTQLSIWRDDCQLARLVVEKRYATDGPPGLKIELAILEMS